jgi:tRNA pseudouridine38-40 synthase
MRTCRLILAYDGLDYHGYQIQSTDRSVQEELGKAFAVIYQREITFYGAGRTDAGVHALAQCVSYHIEDGDPPLPKVLASLRALLPDDITALELDEVHPDFHARFSATGRHYLYRIGLSRMAPYRRRRWETHYTLDVGHMRAALVSLPGVHDFRGYCRAKAVAKGTLCNVHYATLEEVDDELHMRIGANRFLHNMVRVIMGTLVDIGRGHFEPERMAEVLESGDRSRSGNTLPPQGLYLVRVDYPVELLKS